MGHESPSYFDHQGIATDIIYVVFEAFRPTSSVVGQDKDKVIAPSYAPLTLPMIAYVASQGLV